MTTPYLKTEDICWAVKRELDARLRDALADVQARRDAEYSGELPPLPLPYPQRVGVGFNLKILELPASAYPRVSVIGAPRTPSGDTLRSERLMRAQHHVMVEWIIVSLDQEKATVMAWRYGEAILQAILGGQADFLGFRPITSIPETNEAQPTEIVTDRNNPTGSRIFLAGGSTTIPVEGTYSL